jgi:hypothetical protein
MSCSSTKRAPRYPGRCVLGVRELRDAHLTREHIKASAAAEGITIFMTLAGADLRPHFPRCCHAQDPGWLMCLYSTRGIEIRN